MAEAKHGIKEIQEFLAGALVLSVTGKKIMADGKIDWADAQHILALHKDVETLVAAFEGLEKIKEEIKDIDAQEALTLVQSLFKANEEYHKA